MFVSSSTSLICSSKGLTFRYIKTIQSLMLLSVKNTRVEEISKDVVEVLKREEVLKNESALEIRKSNCNPNIYFTKGSGTTSKKTGYLCYFRHGCEEWL